MKMSHSRQKVKRLCIAITKEKGIYIWRPLWQSV